MAEPRYYLQNVKTEKYASVSGYVSDKNKAAEYTEMQIRNRLKVPKSYKKAFLEKLAASGFRMIPLIKKNVGEIKITGEPYEPDDILFCAGTFHFDSNIVRKKVVYSVYRNDLRIPSTGKGDFVKAELKILEKVGRVNK